MEKIKEEKITPKLTREQIILIIKENYDLEIVEVNVLNSYHNQCCQLISENKEKFIFKISNNKMVKQNMYYVEEFSEYFEKNLKDFKCPTFIKNKKKDVITEVIYQEKILISRLANFIEGEILRNTNFRNKENLINLGFMYGKIGSVMQKFEPQHEYTSSGEFSLEIRKLYKLSTRFLEYVTDLEIKKIIIKALELIKENLGTCKDNYRKFRMGNIHNDGNQSNILCNYKDHSKLIGIIDLDDVCYSILINDLAVLLNYICCYKNENWMEDCCLVVKGYNKAIKILDEEFKAIYYLILQRACTSFTRCYYEISKTTENKEYLMNFFDINILSRLLDFGPEKFEREIRKCILD